MRERFQYLGLELSGAKNHKTNLAAIEYYPAEKKLFLLHCYDKIVQSNGHFTPDGALLALIRELSGPGSGKTALAVNVPLELPACLRCARKSCVISSECQVPSMKWVKSFTRRVGALSGKKRLRDFTPYTQRPVELWVKHRVLSKLPQSMWFEIDETMGGNKAPLTARMHFLKRHLSYVQVLEVWPKLSVAVLAAQLGLNKRVVAGYRRLENGTHDREKILEALAQQRGVFIYERDFGKLSQSLTAFDAFMCAYTAFLADNGQCARAPRGFPVHSGWVQYPTV